MIIRVRFARFLIDIVVFCCAGAPLIWCHLFASPTERGFYCTDETIRYPYRQQETVSVRYLIIGVFVIPVSLIFISEVFRFTAWEMNTSHTFTEYRIGNCVIHRVCARLYIFLGYFALGMIFNQLMCNVAKYTIGRLRPHFIDVCRPQGYMICVDDGMRSTAVSVHSYITKYSCEGQSDVDEKTVIARIKEARLSFYSGHSALSFYCASYTALLLQARLYRPVLSNFVLPITQVSLFGCASFVAYSRVKDHMHHWSDVLVGSLMGSIIGVLMALFVVQVFSYREIPTDSVSNKRRTEIASRISDERRSSDSDVELGSGAAATVNTETTTEGDRSD